MPKNILVIGGTRFFGKLLVQRLIRAGHHVTIVAWSRMCYHALLAADILATTVAPSKEELVRLAIIAVIRTFLNYFLGKELDAQAERQQPEPVRSPSRPDAR